MKLQYDRYYQKVYGAWLGKCIGGAAGAKQENFKGVMGYTMENVFPDTLPPNDDFDLQVLWLKEVIAKKGPALTAADLGEAFVKYNLCLANEYSISIKNMELGIAPPLAGTFNNEFFRNSMGCPIRAEIWAMICPGDPDKAVYYAGEDGCIDHGAESIHAEKFYAALESMAITEDRSLSDLIVRALTYIPAESVTADCIRTVYELYRSRTPWDTSRALLLRRFGSSDASYSVINVGFTAGALLYGEGDFERTVLTAVNSGYDTDCTAATACSILGILNGAESIPPYCLDKIGSTIATGTLCIEPSIHTFDDLVRETCEVGVEFSEMHVIQTQIEGAPAFTRRLPSIPAPKVTVAVEYVGTPTIGYGEEKAVILKVSNGTDTGVCGTLRLELPEALTASCTGADLCLAAGESAALTVTYRVKEDAAALPQKNITRAVFLQDGQETASLTYGLSGAYRMKLIGPFFDLYDTRQFDSNPFDQKTPTSLFPMFNGYADIDRPYADETFPKGWDADGQRINLHRDDLEIEDYISYQGPCCVYLKYDFISPREIPCTVFAGNNQPFKLWMNGRLIVSDSEGCIPTIYNRSGDAVIREGENELIIKLIRKNSPIVFGLRFRNLAYRLHWVVDLSSKIEP